MPPVGQEAARGVLGVDAGLDGVAARCRSRPGRTAAARPAATRSCSSTRSSPVTISVTGCSTCRRVFISMKKNSSGRSADDDELDGARAGVAARCGRWRTAAAPMRARVAGSSSGDGASSTTFWWRRCRLHSRSPRCDHVAVRVGEHLHLDVPRAQHESLEEQRVVAERRRRLPAGAGQRVRAGRAARSHHAACPCRRRPPTA